MTSLHAAYEAQTFEDRTLMDRAAADLFAELSQKAIASRGVFSVALSGGTTPRGLYGLLASDAYRGRVDWSSVHVFWADERCVPPDHEESNFRLADDLLLSRVPVLRPNIHRIHGEDESIAAATAYENELRSFFGDGPFTFDLVLLGMGADGHTASLFPEDPALVETEHLAVPVIAGGKEPRRITLTLAAINSARIVLFLVAGAGKARAVRDVLGESDASELPAARVNAAKGRVLWFLDRDAAQLLSPS